MNITVVHCTLYLVWCWFPYFGTADSKTAAGLAPCSSFASCYMKDALCREVWINGKYISFVAISVW